MQSNPSLDVFLKRLIVAPPGRQGAAIESALKLLDGKPAERLLETGAETARQLSMSQMSLWRMKKKGLIDAVKILGSTRYRRADIDRLVALGTVQK